MNGDVLKLYCKEVQRALVGSRPDKEAFLNGLMEGVQSYLDEHPRATLEDIRSQFGSPEDFSEEFASTMPEKKAIQTNNRLKKGIFAAILLIGAAIVILLAAYVVDTWMATHGYTVESPVYNVSRWEEYSGPNDRYY